MTISIGRRMVLSVSLTAAPVRVDLPDLTAAVGATDAELVRLATSAPPDPTQVRFDISSGVRRSLG